MFFKNVRGFQCQSSDMARMFFCSASVHNVNTSTPEKRYVSGFLQLRLLVLTDLSVCSNAKSMGYAVKEQRNQFDECSITRVNHAIVLNYCTRGMGIPNSTHFMAGLWCIQSTSFFTWRLYS